MMQWARMLLPTRRECRIAAATTTRRFIRMTGTARTMKWRPSIGPSRRATTTARRPRTAENPTAKIRVRMHRIPPLRMTPWPAAESPPRTVAKNGKLRRRGLPEERSYRSTSKLLPVPAVIPSARHRSRSRSPRRSGTKSRTNSSRTELASRRSSPPRCEPRPTGWPRTRRMIRAARTAAKRNLVPRTTRMIVTFAERHGTLRPIFPMFGTSLKRRQKNAWH
mmetsp:Transcript_35487/g.85623  ORF Transcript_35487/g.85623 Transcript_35487/m.85623 type:complete len:222 (+) Transcript_35487:192-857(+)